MTIRHLLRALVLLTLLALAFSTGLLWQRSTNLQAPNEILAAGQQTATRAQADQGIPARRLGSEEQATIDLFREASPSVGFITTITRRRDFFSMNVYEMPSGTGSGFVWDREGHIITNFHVIESADRAQVTLADQSTWDAKVIGVAPEKDLAVLQIEAPADLLHPLPLGTSEDLLVGQRAFAIGNPFGLDQTLTTGVVSALGREIMSRTSQRIEDVIQTDAAINPGNSGGPLLDSSGRLIGVNTLIYSPSGASAGIGFAIPVDTVRWVVPDLIEFGRIVRPALGIYPLADNVADRAGIEGVMFVRVDPGGSADQAGLRPLSRDRRGGMVLGDIIVAIDDDAVKTRSDLSLILEKKEVGQTVRVSYVRDGERLETSVVLQAGR